MTSPSLQKSLSLQKGQNTNSSSCVDFQSYTPKSLSQSPLWQRYREYSIKKWKQPNDGDLLSSKERILRHLVDFSQYLAEAKKEFYSKLSAHKKMDEYRMGDFHFIRTLGKGTFGRVMLAKHFYRSLESEYAIKLLDKAKIIKYKQILHVRNEIEILSAADFPFITEMLFCFMSGVYIGIGMPYFTGGDMFNYLRKKGQFEEQETQFYAAQIALVFEYLHFMGIIYRDLKPENIMFSEDGYLKLVDFGFAKKIDDGRTYTLCGTPDYLAPEVLKNKGYGKAIDWWSFGVLVYEMANGQPPFYDLRILKTYDNILRGRIQYPSHFSKSLRNFLEHLIQIDTTKRYGFLKNGIVDIKCHEWFQHFKWNELFNKTLKPFHRPNRMPDDYMIATENNESEPIRSTELSEYVDEFKDF